MKLAAIALGAHALVASSTAHAQSSDGGYGRVDGDLALEAEASATANWSSFDGDGDGGALLGARVAASYLWSAGIFVSYGDGLGVDAQPLERTLAGGVELRPLFLGRFARDLEQGPALLDLFIDSLALGMGGYHEWRPPNACPLSARCELNGFELSLGVELPLVPRAAAPYVALRTALRLPVAADEADERRGPGALVSLSLGYRGVVATGIVDAGDALDVR